MSFFSKEYFDSIQKIYKEELKSNEKGIFIDCGGQDGCSAMKFISVNQNFDCISFEPNPDLWKYYDDVPTTLIKKAVFNKNIVKSMIIDDTRLSGSSLITTKRMKAQTNEQSRRIPVDCIRLSDFIEKISYHYDKIILKLDVEGAEYDILDDLIFSNQIANVDKLYVEFHWEKCNSEEYTEYRHEKLIYKLIDLVPVCEWDATKLGVCLKSNKTLLERNVFLHSHFEDIGKYQKLEVGD